MLASRIFASPASCSPQNVGDVARIEAIENRIDRTVACRVDLAVAGLSQPHEGLVGRPIVGIGLIIAGAFKIADARKQPVVVFVAEWDAADQLLQRGDIGLGESEAVVDRRMRRRCVSSARERRCDHTGPAGVGDRVT